jgi:hypothetical protein
MQFTPSPHKAEEPLQLFLQYVLHEMFGEAIEFVKALEVSLMIRFF